MKYFSVLLVFFLFLSAALAQNTEVAFRFEHRLGSQPLALDTTLFTLPDGRKALLTRAAFYISEIELSTSDGNKVPLNNFYMLVNAESPDKIYSAGNWAVNSITGLTLHLGVDAAHNHLDPSTYPVGYPLANQNPTMHWGWTAGYRFMTIEGLLDKNNDGVPETIFQYHNLGDSLYTAVELAGIQTAENGALLVSLKLDYARLFEKLDMTGNLTQHGSAPINALMMKNAALQGFIRMNQSSGTGTTILRPECISASPNPARGTTMIRYDFGTDEKGLQMILTDAAGAVLLRYDNLPGSGMHEMALNNLPTGLLQYDFYQKGQLLASKKLVVVK